jgi:hypothetical protein
MYENGKEQLNIPSKKLWGLMLGVQRNEIKQNVFFKKIGNLYDNHCLLYQVEIPSLLEYLVGFNFKSNSFFAHSTPSES